MKKIAIFTNSIYTVGGEQRVVCLLANELCKNNQVTIFTMDSKRKTDNIYNISKDIDIRYFHPYKLDMVSFAFRAATHLLPALVFDICPWMLKRAYLAEKYTKLMAKLLGDEFDSVIVTAWQLSILLGEVKKKYNSKVKAIAWEHSSYEAYFETKYLYLYKNEELFKNALQYVDHIVVLNEDYREKYKERLGLDSQVLYNPKSFVSDIKSDLKSKTFLFCGRMDESVKGIDLLYEAFYIFQQKNPDWKLVLAGDGLARIKYQDRAKQDGLSDRITFLGSISNVCETMIESSVLLLTSRFEGFPMSVIEAFEVGIPVLSFDIPAMKPFIECGAAITVPCYNIEEFAGSMGKLADDYELRYELGKKGIEFAQKLDISEIVKQWNDIL